MAHTVRAIRLGTIHGSRAGLLHGAPPEALDIPVFAAAVEGGGQRVLVDTGFGDADRWAHLGPHSVGPGEALDRALAELGWRARDVDVVVNTHLHYDHAAQNHRFPHARIVVSRTEWEFAAAPTGDQAELYPEEWSGPTREHGRVTLVDADTHELAPGLRLIRTPGHTPGHQSVLVDTPEGTLCVTGDAACLLENLAGPVPPGTLASAPDALASIARIRAAADRVLMAHDTGLSPFQSSGFPACPEGSTEGAH